MSDPITFKKGKLTIPYNWAYGENLTNFFKATRNEKKIYGSRCPKCDKVAVPPLDYCSIHFVKMDAELVEVSDHGILQSYTTVYLPFPGQPTEPPYTAALIKLDGSDTQILHMVSDIEPDEIKVGMRVQAVWAEDPKGDLYDIKYFKPEEEATEK